MKDIGAGLANLLGGEAKGYNEGVERALSKSKVRCIEQAAGIGANLCLGLRIEISSIGGILIVASSATAVLAPEQEIAGMKKETISGGACLFGDDGTGQVTINGRVYEKLPEGEKGTAFCLGSRKTWPKGEMYFCEETDAYYHRDFLPAK